MAKVDCVVEALQEKYDAGLKKGAQNKAEKVARNHLEKGVFSDEEIAELVDLPLERVIQLKETI